MKRSGWNGRDTDGGTLKFLESAMCDELKLRVVVRAKANCRECCPDNWHKLSLYGCQ